MAGRVDGDRSPRRRGSLREAPKQSVAAHLGATSSHEIFGDRALASWISQTEIREAFELAILELLPYAAGYEKRLQELSPNSGHLLNTVIGRHELRR